MNTTDLPILSITTLNGSFAPLSATNKFDAYATGDVVTSGYDMIPNGFPVGSNRTLTAVKLTLNYPTIGGTQVWNIVRDSAGARTVLTAVTVPSGGRGVVVNSLSGTLLAGDLILVQCTAANGATYTGAGPTVQFNYSGSLSIPSAPTANGNPTAVPGATSTTINWTAGAGAFSYLVRRDGAPWAITNLLTYTDGGLGANETHTYNVDALVPGNIAVNTNGVVSGPSALYSFYPLVSQALSALTTDFAVTLGTNAGTAATIDATGLLSEKTGSVGGFATQDAEMGVWKRGDTGLGGSNYSAWTRVSDVGFSSSSVIRGLWWNVPTFVSLPTSVTNYLQLQYSSSGYNFRIRAAGINAGVALSMTDSATSPVMATNTGTGGHVNWPITVTVDGTGATLYGFKVQCELIAGDGTQKINMYFGTTAQHAANTLPLINTITLTAAQRSALAIGGHWQGILGGSPAAQQVHFEKNLTVGALSAAGA